MSNEVQENLGTSYNVPDNINEEELMGGTEDNMTCCTTKHIILTKLISHEGINDAQQTMTAIKAANKELTGVSAPCCCLPDSS